MATIQVREIPEEAYEVLRRRARARGQSIQGFMRDQIVMLASRPTKDEALSVIESVLERSRSSAGIESILEDLSSERR